METLKDLIQQNFLIAICAVIVSILIAGLIIRKLKLFAVVLILLASFVLYILFSNGELVGPDLNEIKEKINFDEIKNKVKDKVIEKL